MYRLDRRQFIVSGIALVSAGPTLAQPTGHAGHGQYEKLTEPGRIPRPELAAIQSVFDSPAPKAAQQGRWMREGRLPLPRREMAWATAHEGKMHIVGGYGEQRVDRPYHHVYDAAADRWTDGGATPQRRQPCRRRLPRRQALRHRRLPRTEPQAASALFRLGQRQRWLGTDRARAPPGRLAPRVALDGKLHCIGGAIGDTIRHQALGRLASRLRSEDRHWDDRAPAADRARPYRHARDRRPDPCRRRPRQFLPHQFEPASRLRSGKGQMGRRATRCRRRAPATARCSIAARSS